VCRYSLAISLQGFGLQWENTTVVVMLSIVPSTAFKGSSAVPPCSIMTIGLSPSFGATARRCYQERIWLQVLKTQSIRKPACRVYPDKGGGTKRQAILRRLHNVILTGTLAVLCCILYRIHMKWNVLLEISMSDPCGS
jgi:hypothetical protein